MLLVVIVAVGTAVATRAPRMSWQDWVQMVVTGCATAAASLASVWIVCGKRRWWVRALAAPVLVLVVAASKHSLMWGSYILNHWLYVTSQPVSEYMLMAWRDTPGSVWYWFKSVGLGMAIMCSWLSLMRAAGWFDPFGETATAPAYDSQEWRRQTFARCGALALFGLAAVFPLTLLYHLMTPAAKPQVELPNPNGFDDFLAASRMISAADAGQLRNSNQLSDAQLKAVVTRNQAAFDRAAQGFSKVCANPKTYSASTSQEEVDLLPLLWAMSARGLLASRTFAQEESLAGFWEVLQVTVLADRGGGAGYSMPAQWETGASHWFWGQRELISLRQCAEMADKIWQLESDREPWDVRRARQRIIDENIDWKRHLQSLLMDWSGMDHHEHEKNYYLRRRTELRVLALELAIRAYRAEHGEPPAQLADLVPKYLPAVPEDPFGSGPMQYRVTDSGHTIYSVGPDGDDDSGKRIVSSKGSDGDYSGDELFGPPVPGQTSATNPTVTGDGNSAGKSAEDN
jgi:hypothetical protein